MMYFTPSASMASSARRVALPALVSSSRVTAGPIGVVAGSAAGSTAKYASPAAFGRRLASGPFSSLSPGFADWLLV